MRNLPTGTVTFLFTDIEGSTTLWEKHPEAMKAALAKHDAMLKKAIETHQGHILKTTGDGVLAVFASAIDAVSATLAAQSDLHQWASALPLKVRMGLHTGEAEQRAGDYFGTTLNKAARIMAAGHGGQILISETASRLVSGQLPADVFLQDLGEHALKGLSQPEKIYQLMAPGLPTEFPPLNSVATSKTNLPTPFTSFIGREKEVDEIKSALTTSTSSVQRPSPSPTGGGESARLVTLTGSGGTGKTRLSIEVGAQLLTNFQHGVWLIELAPLSDESQIVPALAQAFGLQELPFNPLKNMVMDYVRDKKLLLILDNCEHLIAACAKLADELLRQCAGLKILASSREALGIAGEVAYRTPSLADSESTQLFVERARAANSKFALTASNASAVAQICHRLDGIPLAIELAAARTKLLSAEQIAARLDDMFRLLVGGSRTALPRQQTLRALIDWSYDLLSDEEKQLLQFASVFVGGWTLDALEFVADEPNTLELLEQLVNKSLVVTEEREGEMRYFLLETIRQYAREKLFEAKQSSAARDRHLVAYVQFAESVEPKLHSDKQEQWLRRVEDEHENLRAALEWSMMQGESVAALRLTGALGWFWFVRGHLSEGRQWLQKVLEFNRGRTVNLPDHKAWYAKALLAAGRLAEAQADYAITQSRAEESLAIFRELGDKPGIALSLHWLGSAAFGQGNYELTRTLHEECLVLYREMGDKGGIGFSLNWLGMIASNQGDHKTAQSLYQESLAFFRELDDKRNLAMTLSLLGGSVFGQGDYVTARTLHEESVTLFQELGDKKCIAECLPDLAAIAQATAQPQRATIILGAVEALLESIGAYLDSVERTHFDSISATARDQLGEATFNALWAEGKSMTMEQAIKFAVEAPHA